MTLIQRLQPHPQRLPPHIHTPHEPDHLALARSLTPHLIHPAIELAQPLQKRLSAPHALELFRNERLHRKAVRALDLQPDQPRQDDQFPRDVEAVQIIAGIRFGEAGRFGLSDFGAPGSAAVFAGGVVHGGEVVEEEAHGAGEDALDAADGVAGADEVVEGGDDWEAGADGGFVVDESAGEVRGMRAVRGLLDGVPEV